MDDKINNILRVDRDVFFFDEKNCIKLINIDIGNKRFSTSKKL